MFALAGFSLRSVEKEYLDDAGIDREEVIETFRFIRFVNRWAGGYRTALMGMELALNACPAEGRALSVLDAGCGGGDMASAVFKWGRRRGYAVRYAGIDRSELTVRLARERYGGPGVDFRQGDIFEPGCPAADIVLASLLFHHFSEDEIRLALPRLLGLARLALVVNDLSRSALSYAVCLLATRFVRGRACRKDALLSIKKGFLPRELSSLVCSLGLRGIVRARPFGRVLLVLPK